MDSRHHGKPIYFNPRPPCGGRPDFSQTTARRKAFQSTSPVWRTTIKHYEGAQTHPFQSTSPVWRTTRDMLYTIINIVISIHVPRVEDDQYFSPALYAPADFNPRPPCGGRPPGAKRKKPAEKFQSTSPVWRTTVMHDGVELFVIISIHVPRVEDDLMKNGRTRSRLCISIHVPRVEDDFE